MRDEAPGFAARGFVVSGPLTTYQELSKLLAMELTEWADVKPGTIITVRRPYCRKPFKFLIEKATPTTGRGYATVEGRRLRMDGTGSTLSTFRAYFDLIHLWDILAIEPSPELVAEAWAARNARWSRNADGKRARGTSHGNQRGSAAQRRARKAWLLTEFGDGEKVSCALGCGAVLTAETMTVDRYPIPGCQGGTYTKGNIRPACSRCNSSAGATIRAS